LFLKEMKMTEQYDVIIIGSGPGGYVAAARAGSVGLKTAIVEKDGALGGTCLHRGCIPTKALLHAADVISDLKDASKMGIVAEGVRVEWDKVQKHKNQIIKSNAGGVKHIMKGRKVDVYNGFGEMNGKNQVRVTHGDGAVTELKTKNIILAVGSVPRALPFAPFDGERIMSSDHILGVEEIPGSLTVIGGGVIGIEFASLFIRLGTKVTVVEALPRILMPADDDVSATLTKELERQGVKIKTKCKVKSIQREGDSVKTVYVDEKGNESNVDSEICLVAIGRGPLTERIGLESTRVQTEKGYIIVNGMMETDEPGVYAIGDCVWTPLLAHTASAEGVVAAEHIAGLAPAAIEYDHTPWCVYCEPPVAWVGLTETEAREAGNDVKIGKFNFAANPKAAILGKKRGFVKFITDAKHGEILGAHIIGPQATDLLAEPAYAMAMETTIEDVAKTVHAHPTLYEAIYEAAAIASDRAIHG
jgi:dihydrolipoamide dehydrogenase